jgi:Haemolysin-type calcium binding protein related domain
LGPAHPVPLMEFRVNNWISTGVAPDNGGPDDPTVIYQVRPYYPLGYNRWGDFVGVRAFIWNAWFWTEFLPPNFIERPDPRCFGTSYGSTNGTGMNAGSTGGGGTGPSTMTGPSWGVGFGNPSGGTTAANDYGIGTEDFLMGTPGAETLTMDASHRGAMGFDSNDTLTTGSFEFDHMFVGGPGDDTTRGRNGNDLYLYRLGDGSDTVDDDASRMIPSAYDTFYAQNVDLADVRFGVSGADLNDLTITMPDGAVVTLLAHYDLYTQKRIDYMQFGADVLTWSQSATKAREDMKQTGTVVGSTSSNTFLHAAGDPSYSIVVRERSGIPRDNILRFVDLASTEVIFEQLGNSIGIRALVSGETVTLTDHMTAAVESRMDRVEFSDGVFYSGSEIVSRMRSEEIMVGVKVGTTGDDEYFFRSDRGNLEIQETGGTDSVTFMGMASTDVDFLRVARTSTFRVQNRTTGFYVDVPGYFNSSTGPHIEALVFTDRSYTRTEAVMRYIDDAMAGVAADPVAGPLVLGNHLANPYIYNGGFPVTTVGEVSGNGSDTLTFANDASTAARFRRTGNHMVFSFEGGARTLVAEEQFGSTTSNWIESYVFTDGVTYTLAQARNRYYADAMADGLIAYGSFYDDTYPYVAGGPSASVDETSQTGNDTFVAADFNVADVVFGRTGANMTVAFPSGAVVTLVNQLGTSSGAWIETLQFADRALTRLQALDLVNEAILASGGTAQGTGSGLNNTYVYRLAFPSASIQEDNTSGTDTVDFVDVPSTAVVFGRTGTDGNGALTIRTADGDVLTLIQFYSSGTGRQIESIRFADGVTYTRAQAIQRAMDESIAIGGAVYGSDLNDVFTVPATGPAVSFTEDNTGGTDSVVFPGVLASQASITRVPATDNVRVTLPSGRQVTVVNMFASSTGRVIESLVFDDGVLNLAAVAAATQASGFAAGGVVYGTRMNDTFIVPATGPSASVLEDNTGGTDTIQFPVASSAVDWARTTNSAALTVELGGGRTITITEMFTGTTARQIETFVFDGEAPRTLAETAQLYMLRAMERYATVYGTRFGDTYRYTRSMGARAIDDTSSGGAGTDAIVVVDANSTDAVWSRPTTSDIRVTLGGGAQITMTGQAAASTARHIETITFADGVSYTRAQMLVLAP